MAAPRTSFVSLLSISLFYLHQTEAVTEFGDFDTLAREATLLYKSYPWPSFANHAGYHSFYPYLNFTCSGNITKVSFITKNKRLGHVSDELRFATWSVGINSAAQDESHFVRKDFADAARSVVVNTSDSYRLYELNLNGSSWIRFDAGDVFGIRRPPGQHSLNPLHQTRGGFNRFTSITTGNNNDWEFDMHFENFGMASNFPLVSLKTDNSTCARGFLSRESLNTILEVDNYEVDIDEGTSLHDLVTSRQFIIPAMNFSRSGILKKWIFAGTYYFCRESVVEFQVWRRNGSGYHLVNETSVEPRPTGYLNVYEVVLPESPPVVVEAGDMVGVYLPEEYKSRYTLAYVEDSEGYEFIEIDDDGDTGNIIDCGTDKCMGRPLVIADIEGLEESSRGSSGGIIAGVVVPILLLVVIVSVIVILILVIYWKKRTVKNNSAVPSDTTRNNPVYGLQDSTQPKEDNTLKGFKPTAAPSTAPPVYEAPDVNPTTRLAQNHTTSASHSHSNNYDGGNAAYEYVETTVSNGRSRDVTNKTPSTKSHQQIALTTNMSYHQIVDKPRNTESNGRSKSHEWGLYVPTTLQRSQLPTAATNSDYTYATLDESHYAALGNVSTQSEQTFFEESDTYWKPASNQEGLYEQLASKKYREILRHQIQLTDHLGSGQFGTVSKGVWQLPGGHSKDVAIKTLQEGATGVNKVKFLQEAAINGQFKHPNVVKLMGVVTLGEPVMIVLEFLANGDLRSFLHKMKPSPGELVESNTPHVLLRFCKEIASGMKYLSGKHFIHRDLAARNILVSAEKHCKISDFGMSRDLEDGTYYVAHGGKIPVKWTAPEALHYKKYSTASDVWSFGAVMYEIWSLGYKPFEEYTNQQVLRKVDKGIRLSPPPGCPKEMYRLMIQCWNPDNSSRPSFSRLFDELSKNPRSHNLLDVTDNTSTQLHPQVKVLGAPLEAGKGLYLALQSAYMRH